MDVHNVNSSAHIQFRPSSFDCNVNSYPKESSNISGHLTFPVGPFEFAYFEYKFARLQMFTPP